MNNIAFLNRICEVYQPKQNRPIELYWQDGQVVLNINGETWKELTLDMVLTSVKQSMAIRYLDNVEVGNAMNKCLPGQ